MMRGGERPLSHTMDPAFKYYFVMPITLLWALISMLGVRKEWKCFIDPPACLEIVYSQSLLRILFGKDVIKNMAITTGWISLGIAFYVMYGL